MKILYLIESLCAGGAERRLVETLKALSRKKNIKFELVIMSKKIHYDSIYNLKINIHFLIRKIKKDPTIYFRLYKICKKFKPDIIHTWGSMTSVYAFPVAKILNIKLINGMITSAPLELKIFGKLWIRSKLTFPFSNIILSNSYAGLKSFNVHRSKKSTYIHNEFDFSRIKNLKDKNKIREKFDIPKGKVVGMVASFTDNKDYETYILAAEKVLDDMNYVTFLAIGGGKNLNKCSLLIKPKNKERIKFLGVQKDVESIVNIFDIGVLLTNQRIIGEGISNSIMEYMALGKPVIAYDGGGTKEILINGKTGFLIDNFNVNELTEKIKYLLNNKNAAIAMGKAGKTRIAKEFSLGKSIKYLINLYESLLT